jgi:TRAP-type C4-dicarboxylate transport system permease small subunit
MRALGRLADGAVRLLALCGSVGVIAMMLHVCADVVLRGLFASPIPATVK